MHPIAYAFMASTFTAYQAFVHPGATVETLIDKGLIVEMIIKCPDGAGIITYSRVERVYCTPDYSCHGAITHAIEHLCR
ncbi:MAG: hypothetical protein KJ622_11895 [Alphaproteobacteria bacterium]|nr:hypothetical protein [Alphaproteobacteria bacterium]